ncbi:MAG TPA: hypothetical protein VM163_11645 [bacterium]|nr:hypothetical protein [bacterium]
MNVLLVEPDYRRLTPARMRQGRLGTKRLRHDETLWYPPLGLMKLSRFHKDRGDNVRFAYGCDHSVLDELWDRVYITTLFTFGWERTIGTTNFYKDATGGIVGNVYIGGIMASMMPEDVHEATGIFPICGILDSAHKIGLPDKTNIDLLPPDYDLIDGGLYAINETYHGYTSRGCVNRCGWCAVPTLEPDYVPYIDIKPVIRELRRSYGDKARLKLMDNNVLASPRLSDIVADLCELGYARGCHTDAEPKKQRTVDFNQGLDASFVTDETMQLLSRLNIRPFRIAFDSLREKPVYLRAIQVARRYGFTDFSNYMLYNWRDTPRDMYERLIVNIRLNAEWRNDQTGLPEATVYSYPMRYAPINGEDGSPNANRRRDLEPPRPKHEVNFLRNPVWTRRFIRNMEIMKGAAHGAISTVPGLALRTIGESFEEFVANLYMPEVLIRNRNKHERRVYTREPKRCPGTGMVEEFRDFILWLLKHPDSAFWEFHEAVSQNTRSAVREYMKRCENKEIEKWLELYLQR